MSLLAVLLSFTVSFPEQPDIQLKITKNDHIRSTLNFIAPHENEFIANQYLITKIEKLGGKFVALKQNGKRMIELRLVEHQLRIDPNRIFTEVGRRATLKKLNPSLNLESKAGLKALQRSKALAQFILKSINSNLSTNSKPTWIAMHNNTNGFENDGNGGEGTISIIRYKKKLQSGSRFLIKAHQADKDEDDLFYVTQAKDFDRMKKDGWNAVLENPIVKTDPNEDDGSLSVFANKSNIRYINIEAERKSENGGSDHILEKKKMIDYIFSLPAEEIKK